MCTYKDICVICIFQNLEKKNFGRFLASKNVNLNFSQTLCRFVTILNPSWCRCYVFRFLRGYMINKQWESGILINVPTSPLSQPAPLSPTQAPDFPNLHKLRHQSINIIKIYPFCRQHQLSPKSKCYCQSEPF